METKATTRRKQDELEMKISELIAEQIAYDYGDDVDKIIDDTLLDYI